MKKRRGSTLVLTIMVLVVLMILSTALLNVMVTNSKQAVMHRNKIQAYYIAKSGAEIVETAIMEMNKDQIEKIEEYLENNQETQFQVNSKKNGQEGFKLDSTKIIEVKDGELVSLSINKEMHNEKIKSIIITSKAKVGSSKETVIKVMGKKPVDSGEESGGYRGVIREHDTIDYLGSKPTKQGKKFIKIDNIDNIEYEKINRKDFREKIKDDSLKGNYYLDFELDDEDFNLKDEKKFNLIMEGVNIYTTGKFELEVASINMKNSSVISEEEILIKTEKQDGVSIDNSTIISYGNIKIDAEETNEKIKISNSVIKSKVKIEIITENEDINIDNTTIVSGSKENEGEIIIKVENDSITINNSAIRAGEDVKIEGKAGNGVTSLNESSIISEDIEIIRKKDEIKLSGSKLVGKKTEGIEDIRPYIKGEKDFYDLPGMPGRSASSEDGRKDSIYQSGYYKKED